MTATEHRDAKLLSDPKPGQDAVFHVHDVSKVYRTSEVEIHALREVDLDLYPGELVVLLGASGSGKATLLNILGGLDRPTSGEVLYRGGHPATPRERPDRWRACEHSSALSRWRACPRRLAQTASSIQARPPCLAPAARTIIGFATRSSQPATLISSPSSRSLVRPHGRGSAARRIRWSGWNRMPRARMRDFALGS